MRACGSGHTVYLLLQYTYYYSIPTTNTQAGAASSKAYARVWQRTNRNVLVDAQPARRRDVLLQAC